MLCLFRLRRLFYVYVCSLYIYVYRYEFTHICLHMSRRRGARRVGGSPLAIRMRLAC